MPHHIKSPAKTDASMICRLSATPNLREMDGTWLCAELSCTSNWLEQRAVMNIPVASQKSMVWSARTGMVGGYAVRYALNTPPLGV